MSGFASVEEVRGFLSQKTDIQGGEYPIYGDFFFPLSGIYTRGADSSFSWFFDLLKVYGPFILFSTAPAYIIIISFWAKTLKNARLNAMKTIYLFCLSAPAAGLPMFLAIDWDRWFPVLFISQYMLVLYFVAVNDAAAVEAFQSIERYFKRHQFLFLVMMVYLASSVFSNNYSVYLSVMLKHIDNFLGFAKP